MRKLLLLSIICAVSVSASAQGSWIHASALKVVNGVMAPIAGATITVCPANAAGIPCTPASVSIFSDAALTQPLSNPFTADAFGNYQFAVASGAYTITVTATGFTGFSYQVSTPAGGASTVTWATLPGGTNSSSAFLIGTGASLGVSGTGTIMANQLPVVQTSFLPTNIAAPAVYMVSDAASSGVCTVGGGLNLALCEWNGSVWAPAGVNAGGIVGVAASITPTATGQIASNQFWMPGFVADPTGSQSGSGSFTSGHIEDVQITYNTALGETLPSLMVALPSGTFSGCSGTNCGLTITAPSLPSGYLSYNVYACDTAAGNCAPQKIAGCTAITSNCVLTSVPGATTAPPTTNTAWAQPPNAQSFPGAPFVSSFSYLAPGVPFIWYQKRDGNYYPWLTEDWNSCDGTNGPPLPCGTPLIIGRTFFRDTGLSGSSFSTQQDGKNAFVGIVHGIASQSGTTVNTNQDRALWVSGESPLGTWSDYGREAIQVVENINGTPTYTGSPDSEDVAISAQLSDAHTGAVSAPNNAFGVMRGTVFHQVGATGLGSCFPCWNGVLMQMSEGSTDTSSSGQWMAAFDAVGNSVATTSGMKYVGFLANVPASPSTKKFASEIGAWILDFATSYAGSFGNDVNIYSQANHPNGGYNRFDGLNEVGRVAFRNATGAGSTTCSSTGTGTGPTCAVSSNSSDSGGTITVTAGTTPSASGTFVLTYNADQAWPFSSTQCVATLSNAGTGAWNTRATVIMGTTNNTSATFNWDNNAVNLTAASTYKLTYMCFGN